VYLRETKGKNRDGSVVRYLQLAHSERHPDTGVPSAKVIHNFGRADQVDKDALARLVASISRFLEPEQAMSAAHGAEGAMQPAVAAGSAARIQLMPQTYRPKQKFVRTQLSPSG
jgi:hypothetical protein